MNEANDTKKEYDPAIDPLSGILPSSRIPKPEPQENPIEQLRERVSNPALPGTLDITHVTEMGLTQRLARPIRCF